VKTRAECLQYATMCERMAADSDYEAGRMTLLATAGQWRTLAKHAAQPKQSVDDQAALERRDVYEGSRAEPARAGRCGKHGTEYAEPGLPKGSLAMPNMHPNTAPMGGRGAPHEDRKHPDKSRKPPRAELTGGHH
jgi:hypothetical protein